MHRYVFAIALSVLITPRASAAPACDNENLIGTWKKLGQRGETAIINALKQRSDCTFDVSDKAVHELKNTGVPDSIIAVMLEKSAAQALGGESSVDATRQSSPASNAVGSVKIVTGGKEYVLNSSPITPEMGSGLGTMMTGGGLFRKIKQNFVVPGESSDTIVPTLDTLYIVVDSSIASPANIRLVRLKEYKDRRIVYTKEGKINIGDTVMDKVDVSIETTPKGLKILPRNSLDPGPYGIVNVASAFQTWTFDIVKGSK